ncbi:MAG: hypothetical protein AAF573_22040 [Bacteroidota bacterium]
MDKQLFKTKIEDFWEWFVVHEEKFRIIRDPNVVREMLNNQVLQFGVFSWEIGKGRSKPHTFTISPNGNPKMLRRSEAIMGEAPDLSHWEFYPAKPPQDWDFTFEMFDSFMVKRKIDAFEWKYLLRMTPDMKLRILLYAENIDFLDEDDKKVAAALVINNIIGEMDKIYYVDSVQFIDFVEEPMEQDIQSLTALKSEFDEIVNTLL